MGLGTLRRPRAGRGHKAKTGETILRTRKGLVKKRESASKRKVCHHHTTRLYQSSLRTQSLPGQKVTSKRTYSIAVESFMRNNL